MKLVTSGCGFIDIDAYAGMTAYAHLLNLKGIPAKAVTTSALNESITPSLLALNVKLDKYEKSDDDEFVIVDVSNKDYLDEMVDANKVVEVIDHHPGCEEYWKNILHEKSRIEFIGAVATIVFEKYEKDGLVSSLTKDMATLLIAGILDNTLNLKSKITTQRDIAAYNKLSKIANLPDDFAEKYFLECQKSIEQDLEKAIENDIKRRESDIVPSVLGQLVLWSKDFILDNKDILYKTLDRLGDTWMFNLISINDGKSYIIANNEKYKRNFEKLFNKQFEGDMMELDEFWLRKEILKKAGVA